MESISKRKHCFCKFLTIVTAIGCIVGFVFNSLAILDGYLSGATTVVSEKEFADKGFKPPVITVCSVVPFKTRPWTNMSYESYDENTLSAGDIFKEFSTSNGVYNTNASVEVNVLYTLQRGRCYTVKFHENVCLSFSCQSEMLFSSF